MISLATAQELAERWSLATLPENGVFPDRHTRADAIAEAEDLAECVVGCNDPDVYTPCDRIEVEALRRFVGAMPCMTSFGLTDHECRYIDRLTIMHGVAIGA